ncbi:unnamed protein product [Penicillium olsonii]|nr:unnamed protein product [Penicillium olsonii]
MLFISSPNATLNHPSLAPSPCTPEGYQVVTPPPFRDQISGNQSLPWMRFMRLFLPQNDVPPDASHSRPGSSPFFNSPRIETAIAKGIYVQLEEHTSFIMPWNSLPHSRSLRSASDTFAAMRIPPPKDEYGPDDIFSMHPGSSSAGIRGSMGSAFYLLSNHLTLAGNLDSLEAVYRDDEMILQILKDIGWDEPRYLEVLISSHEPTVEAITERLFAAALRSYNFDIVEKMVRAGMNPNMVFLNWIGCFVETRFTPLQLLAFDADTEAIDLLISHGADVNLINDDGQSALYRAISGRNLAVIRLLLDSGATVTSRCARSATGVHSVWIEYASLMEDTIDIYLDQHEAIQRDDTEALGLAAEYGNVNMIQRFVSKGAQLNGLIPIPNRLSRKFDGTRQSTMLGIAAGMGKTKAVEMLLHLSAGEDPSSIDLPYVSPLVLATAGGYINICQILLNSGADLRAADDGEKTLLELAVPHKNVPFCQILIDHGAKVDREPQEAQKFPSALMIAVKQNSWPIIDLLIASNARLNDTFKEYPCTILTAAIEVGNVAIIKKLENAGARNLGLGSRKIDNLQTALLLENTKYFQRLLDHSGSDLLEAAISARDDPLVWFLLQRVARLDQHPAAPVKKTPLLAAIETNNFGLVLALLERGVQVTDGALTEAIIRDSTYYLLRILLPRFTGNAPTAVSAAVLDPSMKCLELLREANVGLIGAPLMSHLRWPKKFSRSAKSYSFESTLEIATFMADEFIFAYLLKWTTSTQTNWSRNSVARALTLAIFERKHHCILGLMQLNSNINCSLTVRPSSFSHDERRFTPLQAAVGTKLVSIVRDLLILKRADVNYLGDGKMRRTPLQHAVELGNLEIFDLLLEHGADVNAPAADDGGATALQLAAIKGFVGIARKLLDLGADANQAPAIENGRTALGGAAEHGRIDMLQMLLNGGALVLGEYEDQYFTAVKLAENQGHHAAARLLRSFKESVELAA